MSVRVLFLIYFVFMFLGNLIRSKNNSLSRRFHENTMQYYLRLHRDGAIANVDAQSLYKFLTLYENARYQPSVSYFSTYVCLSDYLKHLMWLYIAYTCLFFSLLF